LLDELVLARADGRLSRLMATWARVDVLVLDDLGLQPSAVSPGTRPAGGHRGPCRHPLDHRHQPLARRTMLTAIV